MPRHTAASTSPDRSEGYRRDLRRRRSSLLEEYHSLLDRLFSDLETEDSEAFEAHLLIESRLFKRLDACLRITRTLVEDDETEDELEPLIRRQRELRSVCAKSAKNLQGRLKNSSLNQRPRRVFEQNQTMLDITC